jgi:hypothetical protein
MPGLLPAKHGIFDRHPELIGLTGFRLEFIRLWRGSSAGWNDGVTGKLTFCDFIKLYLQ